MHTISPQCVWGDNRVLTIYLPQTAILHEFHELQKDKCTYIIISTTGSQNNGFKVPDVPGHYKATLTTLKHTTTYETDFIPIEIVGVDIPSNGFSITGNHKTAAREAEYQFAFTPS
jgi:hypothetical protein